MKTYKLFLLFPVLILSLTYCAQKKSADNQDKNLSSSNYKDNIYYTNHYNPEGKLMRVDIEEINLFMGEESKSRKEEIYSYNDSGKLIEKVTYELYDQDREMILFNKYLDNSEEYIEFNGKDTISYKSTIYDNNKNIIQITDFSYDINDFTGQKELIESYITYNLYDDNNKLIKKREQNLLTNKENITEYLYKTAQDTLIQIEMGNDSKPFRTLKTFYRNKNNKHTFHFDGDNYLLAEEEELLNGEEIVMKVYHEFKGSSFMYDTTWYEKNEEIKFISNSNMFKVITEKKYDDKGNILEEESLMIPNEE